MTAIDDAIAGITSKARSPRRVETVTLFDPALVEQRDELVALWEATNAEDQRSNEPDQAPKVAAAIVELDDQLNDGAREWRFGALSSRAWTELIASHPPTKAQLKAHQEAQEGVPRWQRTTLDHNPDTFNPALIAACAVEPELTVEEADALADDLSPVEYNLILSTCLKLNREPLDPKASLEVGLIRQLSGRSDATAALGEYADPTS